MTNFRRVLLQRNTLFFFNLTMWRHQTLPLNFIFISPKANKMEVKVVPYESCHCFLKNNKKTKFKKEVLL